MAKKVVLGRGLGVLMGEASDVEKPVFENTNQIDIELIDLNPDQPRKHFDEDSLEELAVSIKNLGVIQPVTVHRLDNGRYRLIAGERRFKASKMAGLTQIPAFVRDNTDQNLLEIALVENIHREDLDPIEIAVSYQRLIDEISLTQEQLSERIGKKRATIANYLRLLKLPPEMQFALRTRKITMGHAKALLGVEDEQKQLDLFVQTIENDLSVRKTEELVQLAQTPPLFEPEINTEVSHDGTPVTESKSRQNSNPYEGLQTQLSAFLGSKVEFKVQPKGNGKIIIEFKSNDELEHLLNLFDQLK